ncbi:MAG: ureidoglycolate lyase [Pelagimonas sp.]|jgi:ureidoglycolate lyase|nr:ureidoglycolate lyase [Pelagimonas sp.]
MSETLYTQPLSATGFAPFGEVLEPTGAPDKIINQGLCGRFHDRAALDFDDGRAGISLFQAQLRSLPYRLEMMERHPQGSQAFVPMDSGAFLIVVAPDADRQPGQPQAFLTAPGQAINIRRNTWHGVLCPLAGSGLFAVIDRIGAGANLQEHWFETPYIVQENP